MENPNSPRSFFGGSETAAGSSRDPGAHQPMYPFGSAGPAPRSTEESLTAVHRSPPRAWLRSRFWFLLAIPSAIAIVAFAIFLVRPHGATSQNTRQANKTLKVKTAMKRIDRFVKQNAKRAPTAVAVLPPKSEPATAKTPTEVHYAVGKTSASKQHSKNAKAQKGHMRKQGSMVAASMKSKHAKAKAHSKGHGKAMRKGAKGSRQAATHDGSPQNAVTA